MNYRVGQIYHHDNNYYETLLESKPLDAMCPGHRWIIQGA